MVKERKEISRFNSVESKTLSAESKPYSNLCPQFDSNILSFYLSSAFTFELFAAKRNQTVQEIKLFFLKKL